MKSGIVVLFGLTSFLAAALLFSVQPMIGKMVLPVLGGTPAVWNTCLVFFQVMLLGGYLFAHGIGPDAGDRAAPGIRVSTCLLLAILLALGYSMQPIVIQPGVIGGIRSDDNPALVLLGISVRLGHSAAGDGLGDRTALQCWFALTGSSPGPRSLLPVCRE